MRYNIDTGLIEQGLREALKAKINLLEFKLKEKSPRGEVRVAVEEYMECERIARSFLVPVDAYHNILSSHEDELRKKYDIIIH